MKIDHDYLKNMLEAFEAAAGPTTDIYEIESNGLDYREDRFVFHLALLADENLVEGEDGDGIGYKKYISGEACWTVKPLRLTSKGHEFLQVIRSSKVWDAIKIEFKDASFGTLLKVGKEALENLAKRKLEGLISRDGA